MKVKVRLSDAYLKRFGKDATRYAGATLQTSNEIDMVVGLKEKERLEALTISAPISIKGGEKNGKIPILKITKVEKKKPVDKEVKA